MEENDKKRKASSGSDEQNLKEVSSEQFPNFSQHFLLSEESFEDDRNRTPSGSVIPDKKDIRTFFRQLQRSSDKSWQKGSEKSVRAIKIDNRSASSHKKRGKFKAKDQNRPSGARAGPPKQKKRRIKRKATQSTIDKQNNSKGVTTRAQQKKSISHDESCQETSDEVDVNTSSSDEENFLTPTNTSYEGQVIIHHLLSQSHLEEYKDGMDENRSEDIAAGSEDINCRGQLIQAIDSKMDQISESMDNADFDENGVQVMSVPTVIQMFQELKEEIQKMNRNVGSNTDLASLKQECIQEVANSVDLATSKNTKEIDMCKKEIAIWREKSKILTDVCDRMAVQIGDIEQRLDNFDLNNSKKMVMISGLAGVSEKKELPAYLMDFFKKTLGMKLQIEDAFAIGQINPRPLVAVFQSTADKKRVLDNKQLLKGEVSDANKPIFINEYLPQIVQDRRKREAEVKKLAINVHGEDNVKYTKQGLTVMGTPYRKKVSPPTPKELINVPHEDLRKIMKMEMSKSSDIREENSVFTAYTAPVKSHKQVRDLYIKMKIIQPAARHVVCAYWVDHEESYYALDYHDDGEFTVGRVLMDLLKLNDLRNRVIFVARRYGGVKLGNNRFKCYLDAAVEALEKGKFNNILGVDQILIHLDPREVKKQRAPKPPKGPSAAETSPKSQSARQALFPSRGSPGRYNRPIQQRSDQYEHSYPPLRQGARRGSYNGQPNNRGGSSSTQQQGRSQQMRTPPSNYLDRESMEYEYSFSKPWSHGDVE